MELDSAAGCCRNGCTRADFYHHPTHTPIWGGLSLVQVVFNNHHLDTDFEWHGAYTNHLLASNATEGTVGYIHGRRSPLGSPSMVVYGILLSMSV